MRVLVLYYSQSGNTAAAADTVARKIGADLAVLQETRSRRGVFGSLRSVFEVLTGRHTKLLPLDVDPATYDLIVLGTPVWAARMSTPVRTFIEDHTSRLNHVAFFCTQGSSGGEAVMSAMQTATGRAPVATLVLSHPDLNAATGDAKLERFADALTAFIDETGRLRPVA